MRATLLYHLASGRMVREPATIPAGSTPDEYRDAILKRLSLAMSQAPMITMSQAPMISAVDDRGRGHLIMVANLEDLEIVLEPDGGPPHSTCVDVTNLRAGKAPGSEWACGPECPAAPAATPEAMLPLCRYLRQHKAHVCDRCEGL